MRSSGELGQRSGIEKVVVRGMESEPESINFKNQSFATICFRLSILPPSLGGPRSLEFNRNTSEDTTSGTRSTSLANEQFPYDFEGSGHGSE